MANRIVITGRLLADPELRIVKGETSVATFRIAVPRRFGKGEESDFFNVTAWRKTAEFVAKYFTKGKLIEIDGRLESKPWEDKNKGKHQGVFIVAEYVDFVGDKPKEDIPDADFDPFSGETK